MQNRRLSQWEYVQTFGKHLEIYKHGDLRVGIDNRTGQQILGYKKVAKNEKKGTE